jgi:hypothetical protein
MPQEVLEPSCVHSPARQCVSGRMPQHVDMHREWQPSGFPSTLNHASNAHAAEGLATLIDKDVGPLGPVSPLLPLEELVDLIALQVMDGRYPVLPFNRLMVRSGRSLSSQGRSPG